MPNHLPLASQYRNKHNNGDRYCHHHRPAKPTAHHHYLPLNPSFSHCFLILIHETDSHFLSYNLTIINHDLSPSVIHRDIIHHVSQFRI
ncbi:hypothetical protein L1987_64154 [Smallanthus sonchifolius]|uniref:Uncharacterized protein n=1 Tax=Smallanthus sonchifolius TaxID=185202 RepID=A0ACB9CFN0_9ASTR|nr:hypothetical protein L1987_64154 [Smallanthus sonchifolius]